MSCKYNLPKPYLSASSIATMLRCPKQFKFRYVDGIILPPNIAMLSGTVVHSAFEEYYKDVLTGSPTRMSQDMVVELAEETLEEKTQEEDIEVRVDDKKLARTHIKNAVDAYIPTVGKYVDPVLVEDEVRYESRCGVEVLGYLDLVRYPMEEEQAFNEKLADDDRIKTVVSDYKVTKKKWNINQLINSLQFNIYALATEIKDIEITNLVKSEKKVKDLPKKDDKEASQLQSSTKDINSNLRLLRHRFNGEEFDHLENLIEDVAKTIDSGIFMPCDPSSWCCNETWCGYWHLCRGSNRGGSKVFDLAS